MGNLNARNGFRGSGSHFKIMHRRCLKRDTIRHRTGFHKYCKTFTNQATCNFPRSSVTKQAVVCTALSICITEVLGLNSGWYTCCPPWELTYISPIPPHKNFSTIFGLYHTARSQILTSSALTLPLNATQSKTLTPCLRLIFHKLTVPQLLNAFPAFYEAPNFTAQFTTAH